MKQEKSYSPSGIILFTFLLCFVIRFIDAIIIRLDQTIVNENFIHKVLGIVILAVALRLARLSWKDIGFDVKKLYIPALLGLGLGVARFAVGYGIEFVILSAQGKNPTLDFSLRSFSVDGATIELPVYCIFVAIVFNIINAIMEDGIFRGLFITLYKRKYRFAIANTLAALLFGVWHIVMPIRSWFDGNMTFPGMIFYSVGYTLLSASIALMWGLLFEMTGVVWIGMADHFFNNTIINLLHVTTDTGIDELQIVRALIAQLLALVLVTVLYFRKRRQGACKKDKPSVAL